jgi:predicted amidophosphoribosyltransferase
MKNLEGAFEVSKMTCGGSSVLLVDDVTTTGATFDTCAAILKKAGAREVCAVSVARG